jgi:hypothetical protein
VPLTPEPAAQPISYVIRRPDGDPAAVRRLASAYELLAEVVEVQTQAAANVLGDLLNEWAGVAATAATRPAITPAEDGARVARGLRHVADELRRYAAHLERAHEHHGWSIGRLVAMGAMVTVGVAAIVVTAGAAAPEEAVAVAGIVESAEAATATAEAAGAGAASSLLSTEGWLSVLRPLQAFVVPHLTSAASQVGFEGVTELVTKHRLDAHALEVAAGVGFVGSSVATASEAKLVAASTAAKRASEGAAWAAAGAAGQYADSGSVDPATTVTDGVGGMVGRDIRRVTERVGKRVLRRVQAD